jgi:hypothetical protein
MSFGSNAPEGFVDSVSQLSSTCNSKSKNYEIVSGYASSIFKGDPVVMTGGYIVRGADGAGAVCGVFIGAAYKDTSGVNQWVPYWPAATVTFSEGGVNLPAEAFIIDDPFIEFTIQTSGNTEGSAGTAARVDLGRNANFLLGAGNTNSGRSTTSLNMTTVAVTATLHCKILSLTEGFSTAVATPAIPYKNTLGQNYNNVNVIFNNHKYKGGTGTLGA